MSFILSEEKQRGNNKYPLCKLRTRDKNKYIYYVEDRKNNEDLVKDLINEYYPLVKDEEKKIVLDSVLTHTEPTDLKLEKIYYNILEKLKHRQARFIVPKGKKLQVLPDFSRIEKLYVCGVSGAGKSTFCSEWIKEYLKYYKDNEFYLLSGVEEDEPLDALQPIRVDLQNLPNDPLSLPDELKNSVVMFDDTATLSNIQLRKICVNLLDDIIETGRHYNITCLNTSHMCLDYRNSRKILNEATSVVLFCKAGSNIQNRKYMELYGGLDKDQITKILNLPSRWVYIRRTPPQMVIYEKGCYLI
jgi:hypothetical protein